MIIGAGAAATVISVLQAARQPWQAIHREAQTPRLQGEPSDNLRYMSDPGWAEHGALPMTNGNLPASAEVLAARTSAAFSLLEIFARILEENQVASRGEISERIQSLVASRRQDLVRFERAGGDLDFEAVKHQLAIMERFATVTLKQH
jgi:hypothetical protein